MVPAAFDRLLDLVASAVLNSWTICSDVAAVAAAADVGGQITETLTLTLTRTDNTA